MGSLCRVGFQKRKFLFQTSRGQHSVSASALMYIDCMHAVMLKPASVYPRLGLPYVVKKDIKIIFLMCL